MRGRTVCFRRLVEDIRKSYIRKSEPKTNCASRFVVVEDNVSINAIAVIAK